MRPKRCSRRFGVPGQVVVDHQVGALVDAFAGGVGGQQHLHLRVVPVAAEQGRDALLQVAQRVPVLGEDHQLLMRRGRRPRDRAVAVANRRLPGPAVPPCKGTDQIRVEIHAKATVGGLGCS